MRRPHSGEAGKQVRTACRSGHALHLSKSTTQPHNRPPAPAGGSDKELLALSGRVHRCAEFSEFISREFPQQAEEWNDPLSAAVFLKLMGARWLSPA